MADTDMMFDTTEIIRMSCCSARNEVGRHVQIRASRVLAAFRSAARYLAGTRRLVQSSEQESPPTLERYFKEQFLQKSVFNDFARRARVCCRVELCTPGERPNKFSH